MISCIFTTDFYAIVVFVDDITNITIIINLQTNFCFMPRAAKLLGRYLPSF